MGVTRHAKSAGRAAAFDVAVRTGVRSLGEEIDVLGDPGDETMSDHLRSADEGERVGFWQAQGCPRDALLVGDPAA